MSNNIYNTTGIAVERKDKNLIFFKHSQMNGVSLIVFLFMLVTMLMVFLRPSLQIVTGPILTACFIWLYFKGYEPLVVAVIVIANDALGTMFFGRLSFPYLLLALWVLSLMTKRFDVKIKMVHFAAMSVMLFMFMLLYYNNDITIKSIVYTYTYILALTGVSNNEKDREMLVKGIAITVFLIALHTCITGGVTFYELKGNSKQFLRKGILGIGVGDANFSSLVLNLGIACTLFDKDFRWYVKLGFIVAMLGALAVTLSASGLLGLVLVIFGFSIIKREALPKKIKNGLFLILIISVIVTVYFNLPAEMRNETIDAYVDRMVEKLGFLNAGNMNELTTNRANLLTRSLDYFANQSSYFKILFGFNSVAIIGESKVVPHNTYIDLLLQIGLVGTLVTVIYIIKKFFSTLFDKSRSRRDILLKIIFLFFFLNLSIYNGSMFALAYVVLMIM